MPLQGQKWLTQITLTLPTVAQQQALIPPLPLHSLEENWTSPRGDSSLLPAGCLHPPSRQQTGYLFGPLGLKQFSDKRDFQKGKLFCRVSRPKRSHFLTPKGGPQDDFCPIFFHLFQAFLTCQWGRMLGVGFLSFKKARNEIKNRPSFILGGVKHKNDIICDLISLWIP